MKHPTYCHPLDFVCGLKYCLVDDRVNVEYKPSPETFFVEEIIDLESLGFSRDYGNYTLYRLVKKGVDTFKALRAIAGYYRIPVSNIYYAGLKDRDSTSIQYIVIKKGLLREEPSIDEETTIDKNVSIKKIGYLRKKLSKKHILYNKFSIKIDSRVDEDKLKKILKVIEEHGLPSYYGYQRFGIIRYNTHLIGKYIIKNNYVDTLYEILYSIYPRENIDNIRSRISKTYKYLYYEEILQKHIKKRISLDNIIKKLGQKLATLYIQSLQSYIFNNILNKFIEERGFIKEEICVPGPGCIDKYSRSYEAMDVASIDDLVNALKKHRIRGYYRKTLFKPVDLEVKHGKSYLWITFYLEKGMYATIVLREIFKENLIL